MAAPTHCRNEAYRDFERQMPTLHTDTGLLRAAIAISRHEIRGVHTDLIEGVLDQYAQEIARRAPGLHDRAPDPSRNEALLATVHAVLFDEVGYRGNQERYEDTRNSHIPEVVRTRRGIPVSLCLVYKAVCARVGIAVTGVDAPFHFLCRVDTPGTPILVDAFGNGRMVAPLEAMQAIKDVLPASDDSIVVDLDNDPSPEDLRRQAEVFLPPATHAGWIARMLRNLAVLYERQGRPNDLYAMIELGQLLSEHHPAGPTGLDAPDRQPPDPDDDLDS